MDIQTDYTSDIEYIGAYCGSRIYMKRDDKIPFSYGGNKVRIAAELMKDVRDGGYSAVISYGSASSNMNRAVAEMARAQGVKCYVIIKTGQEETETLAAADVKSLVQIQTKAQQADSTGRPVTENERIVRASGAEFLYCTGSNVRTCVEAAIVRAEADGYKPYYIYGDSTGRGNEPALMRASYNEYAEIRAYEQETGADFDAIVLTAGTGMTIAGLAAAVNDEDAAAPRLIGISAARTAESSIDHIKAALLSYYGGDDSRISMMPDIKDGYLCGGYGRYNAEIEEVIYQMEDKGIALDPTYTGKSYWGMLKEIEAGSIKGDILFIHTGGYPVYLDWKTKLVMQH